MKTAAREVTKDEIEIFDRDGVVCLRNFLDPHWVEEIGAAIDEQTGANVDGALGAGAGVPILAQNYLAFKYPRFQPFSRDVALARGVATLLHATSLNLYDDGYLVKRPGCEPELPWHHDLPYHPLDGWKVASAWIAVDAASKENGAVEYVAGSHRWEGLFRPAAFNRADDPRYDAYEDSELRPMPDIDADRAPWDIVSWESNVGDVTVHHARTVHRSGGNQTASKNRRALIMRYTGDDVRWAPGRTYDELGGGNGYPIETGLQAGDGLTSRLFPLLWQESGLQVGASA